MYVVQLFLTHKWPSLTTITKAVSVTPSLGQEVLQAGPQHEFLFFGMLSNDWLFTDNAELLCFGSETDMLVNSVSEQV